MIRIVENNDWITASLFLSILALVFALYLNREASIKYFFGQKIEEAINIALTWLIVSFVFCVQLALIVYRFVPMVPDWLTKYDWNGYTFSKFGYTLVVILFFYFIKFVLTECFYIAIYQKTLIKRLIFNASKIYFYFTALLIIQVFTVTYTNIDRRILLHIFLISSILMFIFKISLYLFSKNNFLPKEWYYKFLYICTLQIAPLFALWKLLFLF